MDKINLGAVVGTHCVKAVCDYGNQSGWVLLRWRKAAPDLAAHSSIPQSLFIDAQQKKKKKKISYLWKTDLFWEFHSEKLQNRIVVYSIAQWTK